MAQQTQHSATRGLSSGGIRTRGQRGDDDAEDYYDFLPSDSNSSDNEGDDERSGSEPGDMQRDTMMIERVTQAVVVGAADTSAVLTPIGALGAASAGEKTRRSNRSHSREQLSTQETLLAQVATGAVILTGGKKLHVSSESLAQHAARKSQLEHALDALAEAATMHSTNSSSASGVTPGEAPFRFRAQPPPQDASSSEDVDMVAPDLPTASSSVGGSSSNVAKKSAAASKRDGDDRGDADPLYDDTMDDADEQWVKRNFRPQGGAETDATLCCPCCFMTVCMDCQRHVQYSTQFRASVAVNCRIKKDEILTYASDAASVSALPFHKRLNRAVASAARTSASATGAAFSLLTADEFHPVACSDCGTTVGVLDRRQHYHFFNVLPSTC